MLKDSQMHPSQVNSHNSTAYTSSLCNAGKADDRSTVTPDVTAHDNVQEVGVEDIFLDNRTDIILGRSSFDVAVDGTRRQQDHMCFDIFEDAVTSEASASLGIRHFFQDDSPPHPDSGAEFFTPPSSSEGPQFMGELINELANRQTTSCHPGEVSTNGSAARARTLRDVMPASNKWAKHRRCNPRRRFIEASSSRSLPPLLDRDRIECGETCNIDADDAPSSLTGKHHSTRNHKVHRKLAAKADEEVWDKWLVRFAPLQEGH
jgi:hypothetical protein